MSVRADAVRVKICGLREVAHVTAAAEAGAAYLGFVFVEKSPRAVTPDQAAQLAAATPPGVAKVGLFVDPTDDALNGCLQRCPLDMIQLHGDEPPRRSAEVRARFGLPVIKAVPIADADDAANITAHEATADQVLCDAKSTTAGALPGGEGVAFDWRLIAGRSWSRPWMLAGGLTAATVGAAVRLTGARQVDVSSGVERIRGEKDVELIKAFLRASHAADGRFGAEASDGPAVAPALK